MSLFLDASLLVAALSKEVASRRVQTWLGRQLQGDLAISDWVVTQVASALATKVGTRAMASDEHDAALTAFAELTRSLDIRPVSRSAFRAAARLCGSHALGRRSGDALHLALCLEAADTLCTLDRKFASAAAASGLATLLV